MALKTYTIAHTTEHGWPPDSEFILDNRPEQMIEWLKKAPIIEKDDPGVVNHRVDGPAVIWDDGLEEWYLDGERHRVGGPAVIDLLPPEPAYAWWVHGKQTESYEYYQHLTGCSDEELMMLTLKWGSKWETIITI